MLVINIKRDSTLICTFNADPHLLSDYAIKSPAPTGRFDGVLESWQVTESIKVTLFASTSAALIDLYHDLQTAFLVDVPAYEDKGGSGPRITLYAMLTEEGVWYEAEVVKGTVEVDKNTLNPAFLQSKTLEVVLGWTRRAWVTPDFTQVPLTNLYGTNDTAGLRVDGHHISGAANNTVSTELNYISTVQPCPIKLEMRNPNAFDLGRVFVGLNTTGSPSLIDYQLQAESATLNATYASSVAFAADSGGTRVNVSALPTSAVTLATWDLSATQLTRMRSNWFHIFMRIPVTPASNSIQVRFKLTDDTYPSVVLAETKWVNLDTFYMLQPVDVLRILPVMFKLYNYFLGVKLVMEARDPDASGNTFSLDFVTLMPVEGAQGFRMLSPISTSVGLVSGYWLVDDGTIPDQYTDTLSGSNVRKTYNSYGGPLRLKADTSYQVFVFLFDRPDGVHEITDRMTIRLYYKPTKLTII